MIDPTLRSPAASGTIRPPPKVMGVGGKGNSALLMIGTSGPMYDIGKQQGEKFAGVLEKCAVRFVGLMGSRRTDLDQVAARVRKIVEQDSPHLLEETAGMAEGSGMNKDRLFKLRFYGIIAPHHPVECSAFAHLLLGV